MKKKSRWQLPEVLRMWTEQPTVIRRYFDDELKYTQLCEEVVYILQRNLKEANIEYSSIICRIKPLESFLKKSAKKNCKTPFSEITDIAGVRLVYLYQNDLSKIEKIINERFQVQEKEEKGTDEFGYRGIHFLVYLKRECGIRYDDLKDYICEIQVRTVIEDAWAIFDHHLEYKQEIDIPEKLKGTIKKLSVILRNADGQFDKIRDEANKYRKEIAQYAKEIMELFKQPVNLDTLKLFLEKMFPEKRVDASNYELSPLVGSLYAHNIKKVWDIRKLLLRTEEARKKFNEEIGGAALSFFEIQRALAFENQKYRNATYGRYPQDMELFKKHEHLLKSDEDTNI
ncbi:MAG: hypothetical protein WBB37_07350 [bacterium]